MKQESSLSESNHSGSQDWFPSQRPQTALIEQILQEFLGHTDVTLKANPTSFHTGLLLVGLMIFFGDRFDLLVGGHLTPVADVFQFVHSFLRPSNFGICRFSSYFGKNRLCVCATPVPMGVVGPTTVKWKVVRSQKKVARISQSQALWAEKSHGNEKKDSHQVGYKSL